MTLPLLVEWALREWLWMWPMKAATVERRWSCVTRSVARTRSDVQGPVGKGGVGGVAKDDMEDAGLPLFTDPRVCVFVVGTPRLTDDSLDLSIPAVLGNN